MQIDKNVPIPTKGCWVTLASQMEEGDSVLTVTVSQKSGLIAALTRQGAEVVQRKEGSGTRIWRGKHKNRKLSG